ncbi:hypothetical protein TWF481_002007 [Arthrobotrys musiformis]|uniref:RNase III domain-containing protein n=1 Tax=Arthrobotrys musiformis TaxID=47236 RepID=A0AAV9VWB2_9PEZI
MEGLHQYILNHTDSDTIHENGNRQSFEQLGQVPHTPRQINYPYNIEVTDECLERAIDVLKLAFPRMRVPDFKADNAGWPEGPPTFGSRWQLAKVFVSKFALINPKPGEHLKARSIKAYGYNFFENNQRLREIGCHLLASVVSLAVMKRTEDFSGPVMAAATNKLRQRDVLSALAYLYGLDEFILTGMSSSGEPRKLDRTMLADCFLALVAAVYQDNGWEVMRDWLEDLVLPVLSLALESQDVKHAYDKGQEFAMAAGRRRELSANSQALQSPVISVSAPTQGQAPAQKSGSPLLDAWMELYAPGQRARIVHHTENHAGIYLGETCLATAWGGTKAEAEKNAIELALDKLEEAPSSEVEQEDIKEDGNGEENEDEDDDDDDVEVPIDLSKYIYSEDGRPDEEDVVEEGDIVYGGDRFTRMEEVEMAKQDRREKKREKGRRKKEKIEEKKMEKRRAANAAAGERATKREKKAEKKAAKRTGQNGGKKVRGGAR